MGLTPHREAKAASEWRRSGLLPAAMRRVAAVSGPMPKPSTSSLSEKHGWRVFGGYDGGSPVAGSR